MIGREEATTKVADAWTKILNRAGYKHNGLYDLDTQDPKVAQALGRLLFDYMTATIYDMDFGGYSDLELQGLVALFGDTAKFIDSMEM